MTPHVPGLDMIEEFIDKETEAALVEQIDARPWRVSVRGRRDQCYGGIFEYAGDTLGDTSFVPIPRFLEPIGSRLVDDGTFETFPEQVIVNEYLPAQSLSPHIDVVDLFGPVVITLSLLTPIYMKFIHDRERERRFEMLLRPRSLVVMRGEARYGWRHGIQGRKSDRIAGEIVPRTRRVSVSLRNLNPGNIAIPDEIFEVADRKRS